jgi:hypothetical protein
MMMPNSETNVCNEEVAEMLYLFDTNSHVRNAAGIILNAALGGGVVFSSKALGGGDLDPAFDAWLKRTWTTWLEGFWRQIWSVGFAACTVAKHDLYGEEPRLLSLSLVDIAFTQSVTGPEDWIFTNRKTGAVVPGVQVFVQDVPSPDGSIRSLVHTLKPDLEYEAEIRECSVVSATFRSRPIFLMEQQRPRYRTEELESSLKANDIFEAQHEDQATTWGRRIASAAVAVGSFRSRESPCQFLMPKDRKVVTIPTGNSSGVDFSGVSSTVLRQVFASFSIPPSIFVESKGVSGGAAENHSVSSNRVKLSENDFLWGL